MRAAVEAAPFPEPTGWRGQAQSVGPAALDTHRTVFLEEHTFGKGMLQNCRDAEKAADMWPKRLPPLSLYPEDGFPLATVPLHMTRTLLKRPQVSGQSCLR